MVNSREKGKRIERLVRDWFEARGYKAKRTQQFSGADGTSDVEVAGLDVHWEVKGRPNHACLRFLEQAERDSAGQRMPVVFLWEDGGKVGVVLRPEVLLGLLEDRGEPEGLVKVRKLAEARRAAHAFVDAFLDSEEKRVRSAGISGSVGHEREPTTPG
jgi:hypothetical protein